MTTRSLVETYRCFGRMHCLRLPWLSRQQVLKRHYAFTIIWHHHGSGG